MKVYTSQQTRVEIIEGNLELMAKAMAEREDRGRWPCGEHPVLTKHAGECQKQVAGRISLLL